MQTAHPHTVAHASLRVLPLALALACGARQAPAPPVEATVEASAGAPPETPPEAPRIVALAWDEAQEPVVRAVFETMADEAACPTVRVEVRQGETWRALHITEGLPTVAIGPHGEVAGQVSCAERQSGAFVDDTWLPLTEPELAMGVSWSAEQVVFVAADLAAPTAARVFSRGDAGWSEVPLVCQPLVDGEEEGDLVFAGFHMRELLRKDLNEDGFMEVLVEEEGSCGTGGCTATLLVPCDASTWRAAGEIDYLDSVTVGDGWDLRHAPLVSTSHWMNPDGVVSVSTVTYRWNGLRYARTRAQ